MAVAAQARTRASALREALDTSEVLAKEAGGVVDGYTAHLELLMESVERVAARAQLLTNARRQIDGALKQTNELLEHLDTPRKVQSRIKQGPAAGLEAFLDSLGVLEECIHFLCQHRSIQTVHESLRTASGLCDEAMLLCYDDFQSHVKRHARVPSRGTKTHSLGQLLEGQEGGESSRPGGEEAMPAEVVARLQRLYEAMQRHGDTSCLKVYVEVRVTVIENMQLAVLGKRPAADDLHRLSWPVVERRMHAWAALNADVAGHLPFEQRASHAIFGRKLGQAALLDIVQPWSAQAHQAAELFMGYRRVPEKAFGLIDMAEKTAECLPSFAEILPDASVRGWQKLLTSFAIESRVTYAEFRASLSHDLNRHTVGDGSVHPLAAQTVAFLKRLLTFRSAAAVVFDQAELPTADLFQPGVQTMAQRQALRSGLEELLSLLWSSLTAIARACKNKALGALFLMNNAHYQLKSVQTSASLNAISHDWQDGCEEKVEQYGTRYQQSAWGPILEVMREEFQAGDAKATWIKEKASMKEKWRHVSAALDAIVEQQRTWSVPDFALRANLRDAILEDFLPTYKVFWRKHEVLPFARNADKYMKFSPDQLARVVTEELFESHSAPDQSAGGSGPGRTGQPPPQ